MGAKDFCFLNTSASIRQQPRRLDIHLLVIFAFHCNKLIIIIIKLLYSTLAVVTKTSGFSAVGVGRS